MHGEVSHLGDVIGTYLTGLASRPLMLCQECTCVLAYKCMFVVCACATFACTSDCTTGEGAPWAFGHFGQMINFTSMAGVLNCCKVNGSKVPSSYV